ncbi:ATP-dependent helicase HrpB [Afifella marina]|uniref:ATP-dependent helicase HrpB n=1 Tax=Afifella marina DSM 2698 TaxID=1120955 RepID=A0A1G5M4L7_AFIMA|nr:ATP-dependent helicase HrpB [Afifella marina]MBK1622995.1 ATP-dependent helicase HrpB [Afifella marina DSM 2698]MBK1625989.1 ATP-dependent helicase HrpB [Afifella marina]MBK5917813.1 ATP-dependent helicase HrpB [Afifella marina]RAI18242.1 ATP-dependent helicase HrpB [Afifella marina DSM 2698]SCZ20016.1 ATP-dependent helicase HrpB [Afifella marina DSM 2698]
MNALRLPVEEALPALFDALRVPGAAVLIAPTGAGKTTRVPLAVLEEGLAGTGKIIVVEPRRLAARAAASRMAKMLGEEVGQTVGYRVRMESRISRTTRIELVTGGVFVRMILDDPGLEGIGAILFDEVHERSIDADLGVALALDARSALRPDVKLCAMSATVDGARFSALFGDAPVVEGAGRLFPVDTRYLGQSPNRRAEDGVEAAILQALREEEGSVLAFLPGQAEILRLADRLAGKVGAHVDLAPLYGALDLKDQDRAVRPAAAGRRKVVLATSIAETSLTIEGVRIVVDSGLSRRPRYDPGSGLTRLETVRVSRAAADQRRGRAGRTEPGLCFRLWDEPQNAGLMPFDRPEILEAELSAFVLSLLSWGVREPEALAWLDPPPQAAFSEAMELLGRLGAIDRSGLLSEHGKALATFPLAPRLAHMILLAAENGAAWEAAEIAVLVSEQGLGGRSSDLHHRLSVVRGARGGRGAKAREAAKRWARLAEETVGRKPREGATSAGLHLAAAWPERIAKSRGPGGRFLMANGRGAYLDEGDPLAAEEFLAIAEVQGGGADARILLAAPLTRGEIEAAFEISEDDEFSYDSAADRINARRVRRLGALVISAKPLKSFDPEKAAALLAEAALKRGLEALPWPEETRQIFDRIAFLRRHEGDAWPDLSDKALAERAEEWLLPLAGTSLSLGGISRDSVKEATQPLIPWSKLQELDRKAPATFVAPSGREVAIDYSGDTPTVAITPQNLFSLDVHPRILDGRLPLTFELLSPAGRPMQVTQDLPGFWRGSWRDVRAEMRGRYLKHDWPEDPATAAPSTGAKRRKS